MLASQLGAGDRHSRTESVLIRSPDGGRLALGMRAMR